VGLFRSWPPQSGAAIGRFDELCGIISLPRGHNGARPQLDLVTFPRATSVANNGEWLCALFGKAWNVASNVVRPWREPGLALLPAQPLQQSDRSEPERVYSAPELFCGVRGDAKQFESSRCLATKLVVGNEATTGIRRSELLASKKTTVQERS
jgi:hypothetical protein